MKFYNKIGLYLLALLIFAGCASTKVTSRDEIVTGKLPRPAHIWVYDFAATPEDVPDESALAGQHSVYTAKMLTGFRAGENWGEDDASSQLRPFRSQTSEIGSGSSSEGRPP